MLYSDSPAIFSSNWPSPRPGAAHNYLFFINFQRKRLTISRNSRRHRLEPTRLTGQSLLSSGHFYCCPKPEIHTISIFSYLWFPFILSAFYLIHYFHYLFQYVPISFPLVASNFFKFQMLGILSNRTDFRTYAE